MSSATVNYATATSVSSSTLQSTTSPVSTASTQSASNAAVIFSVQATATANGNAVAMGSMSISGSPGAVFGAVGSIGSVIINPVPNSSSSTSTTTTETKDKLNDVKVALCKFYGRQNNIANSIDGKEFPIIKVQLSLVTERCEEKNTRDATLEQDSKDTKAQTNVNKYHEDWYKAKQTIEVEKLFELTDEEKEKDNRAVKNKSVNKIRVVGPAGIGKTTFTQYVAYKWATAGLWNDRFKYVFWIKLRNLVNYADKEDPKLSYIIFKECLADVVTEVEEDSCKENIKTILDKQREQTLLILDGYDEITGLLSDPTKSTKGIFNKFKQLFPNLILTSRPYRLDGLHDIQFDRKLENCGFSSEQITEYIDNYFAEQKDRAKEMKYWLEPREMVMGLAHIPVNLNILCALSDRFIKPEAQTIQTSSDTKDSKESKDVRAEQIPTVATTIAEDDLNLATLYRKMVGYLLHKHYLISTHQLTEDDVIGTNGIEKICSSGLVYFGKVALKALDSSNPTLIKADLFTEVDKECDEKEYLFKNPVLRMVFLRAIDNSNKKDIDKTYEFLHFSFQEFLAARYLVQLLKSANKSDVEAARKFFRMEKYNPSYYMVFNFAAGLVHLEDELILQVFWQELLNEPKDLTGIGHIGLMIRCLDACMLDKKIPNLDNRIKEIQQWLQIIIYDRKPYHFDFIFSEVLDDYFISVLRDSSILLRSRICGEVKIPRAQEKNIIKIDLGKAEGIGEKAVIPEIMKRISTALEAKEENAREDALYEIGEIGEKAVTPEILKELSIALVDKEKDIKKAALCAISKIGEKAATPEILKGINDALKAKEEDVIEAALDAIEEIGETAVMVMPEILRGISDVLKAKEEDLIEAALYAIRKIGEKAATPEILNGINTALKSTGYAIRKAALYAIESIGENAATPDILHGVTQALDVYQWDIRDTACVAIYAIGVKKISSEILAKIIFNLKNSKFLFSEREIANYLLSVSLSDLLSKYLNVASPILLYLITNLALFQHKVITITDTDIKIYDSHQTYNIPLPKQADIKGQRIAALKQAFGLESSQDEITQLNSAERLLKVVTTNANYTQTVSSAASSSSSSFFSSSSTVVSSSNSLTTAADTSLSSTTATAFSCSAAKSEAAKVVAQENILRAAQLNLRENQNRSVPSTTASSPTSSFSSSRRYVFVPRTTTSNSSATTTTTANTATVASSTDASALGTTAATTSMGNARKNL